MPDIDAVLRRSALSDGFALVDTPKAVLGLGVALEDTPDPVVFGLALTCTWGVV